jgi:hypothetical protein
MTLLVHLVWSTASASAQLGTARGAAALGFVAVLIALVAAHRSLRRRLEAARADEVLEAEFARLENEPGPAVSEEAAASVSRKPSS